MPDRVIRDELLRSERYWAVSMQAQQCYVHLLLVVDDAARFSGKNFTLRASCFPGRPIEAHAMEKMLSELVDVDLIRLYQIDGERYVFVPRFRNRRRYVSSSRYPAPPNTINDLPPEKSASSQPQVIPKSASSQEERGRRGVGVGVGVGDSAATQPHQPATQASARSKSEAPKIPACPHLEILKAWAEVLPMLPQHDPGLWAGARADHLRARWRETAVLKGWRSVDEGLVYFRKLFAWVGKSAFLAGRAKPRNGGRPFVIELEWLVNAANWAKVLEGKYHEEMA
jgi:hypothetical protein